MKSCCIERRKSYHIKVPREFQFDDIQKRLVRTITEKASAMLVDADLDYSLLRKCRPDRYFSNQYNLN